MKATIINILFQPEDIGDKYSDFTFIYNTYIAVINKQESSNFTLR